MQGHRRCRGWLWGNWMGGCRRRLLALRSEIIQHAVLLAYDIVFPEEEDRPIASTRIAAALEAVKGSLAKLLATAPRVALVRDGALVVIAGPPNAGKSSLFNALLGEARALVREIPGTTRDAIEALLDVPGMPLRLIDTAGLRATDDVVERLGIEVSEKYLGPAQLVLACAEDVAGLVTTIERVRPLTGAPMMAVLTKADSRPNLLGELAMASVAKSAVLADGAAIRDANGGSEVGDSPFPDQRASTIVLAVSAENGTGLRALIGSIVAIDRRALNRRKCT